MPIEIAKLIPTLRTSGKIAPDTINHAQLLNIVNQISNEAISILPKKRSGFSYETLIYVQLYAQLTGLSPKQATQNLQHRWKGYEHIFQSFQTSEFINRKRRRAIPDQPTLCRFKKRIANRNIAENFTNILLWGQFLYTLRSNLIGKALTLIADYNDEPCKANPEDPYCFGTKDGKFVNRTLVFSILSGDLHLVIATFKIKKNQDKLPFFEEIINKFHAYDIEILYLLLDRGFYRKNLLERCKQWRINVIMPGRKCTASTKKIRMWLQDKEERRGNFLLPLRYVRDVGQRQLSMDIILYGKKGHTLSEVKRDFKSGLISQETASKRVFPLLFIRGNNKGVTRVKGSETYIRGLYRKRWSIEIAFRTVHRIGIGSSAHCRDIRLLDFGSKCFIYNQWQISRVIQSMVSSCAEVLSLKEFCGRLRLNRSLWCLKDVSS